MRRQDKGNERWRKKGSHWKGKVQGTGAGEGEGVEESAVGKGVGWVSVFTRRVPLRL